MTRALPALAAALVVTLMSACSASGPPEMTRVSEKEVLVDGVRTVIRTYSSEKLSDNPILLIALHGDTAPWERSGAQYVFAERIVADHEDVVAVGMLRPGYADPEGRVSDGEQGEGIGDNYGPPRTGQIANAIRALADHYNARRTVLVGESGGAATAANLIALHDDIAGQAVLIVCPCDVEAWRASMLETTGNAVFGGEIAFTSPINLVDRISEKTAITIIAGSRDTVAPPKLVRGYYDALADAGKNVDWILVDGGHGIFLDPTVIKATGAALVTDHAVRR